MPVVRCPSCQLISNVEEQTSGRCPACQAHLPAPAGSSPAPSSFPNKGARRLGGTILLGGVLFLGCAVLWYALGQPLLTPKWKLRPSSTLELLPMPVEDEPKDGPAPPTGSGQGLLPAETGQEAVP